MPLDYIDIKTGKTKSEMELEKIKEEKESLQKQISEMDAVVLEILMTIALQGGERIV